mmetsp:Transcript_31883/g.92342  ORF Transcript_31883/g.92342 Transcript_31883/m.92342 type:complete len:206 (+) Transcript_31883:375-992(+)
MRRELSLASSRSASLVGRLAAEAIRRTRATDAGSRAADSMSELVFGSPSQSMTTASACTLCCHISGTSELSHLQSSPMASSGQGSIASNPSSVTMPITLPYRLLPPIRRKKGASTSRQESSSITVTSTPCSLSLARPPPLTRGLGSTTPATTRATPAARSASQHGGVLPWWLHGSSDTYAVDPLARSPACLSANTSAWGSPAFGW